MIIKCQTPQIFAKIVILIVLQVNVLLEQILLNVYNVLLQHYFYQMH